MDRLLKTIGGWCLGWQRKVILGVSVVVDTTPPGTARPNTWASRSTSPHVAPPCTRTVPPRSGIWCCTRLLSPYAASKAAAPPRMGIQMSRLSKGITAPPRRREWRSDR